MDVLTFAQLTKDGYPHGIKNPVDFAQSLREMADEVERGTLIVQKVEQIHTNKGDDWGRLQLHFELVLKASEN